LSDYYTASGNPPGRWVGAGAANLAVEGQVREEQMRVLFGRRVHPHADRIVALQTAAGASQDAAEWAAKLGRAFPHYTPGTRGYRSPARAPGRLDLLAQYAVNTLT
jgi:hypothetical protein